MARVASRPMPRSSSAGGRAALLWLAAAAISAFTIWRYLEPFDEGFLLQAATRMADGQWPYGDFGWPYGPGQPLLVAAAFEAFEPSVVWWRVLRVAADASIAVLVWALVRPEAGDRWALAGWLAAAVTIAQPTTANPFAAALALRPRRRARGRARQAGRRGPPRRARDVLAPRPRRARRPGRARGRRRAVRPAHFICAAERGQTPSPAPRSRRRALLYRPAFAVAAGPGELWDSLVAEAARDGEWWRLPFPLSYDGPLRGWPPQDLAEDAKDVLGYYLPLIGVVGAAAVAAVLVARRWRPSAAATGLLVLAAGSLLYLVSRPDELHVQPLLICLCALIPMAAARLAAPGRGARADLRPRPDPARRRRQPALGAAAAAGPRAGPPRGRPRHPRPARGGRGAAAARAAGPAARPAGGADLRRAAALGPRDAHEPADPLPRPPAQRARPRRDRAGAPAGAGADRRRAPPRSGRGSSSAGPTRSRPGPSRTAAAARAARASSTSTSRPRTASTAASAHTTCSCATIEE